MLFVVDRPRLLRMIAIVRDDGPSRRGQSAPLVRIAAKDDTATVSGEKASATFPSRSTSRRLFLRPTLFRRLVRTFAGEKFFTFQMNSRGLAFGMSVCRLRVRTWCTIPIRTMRRTDGPPSIGC
jgi:hypothetical protein